MRAKDKVVFNLDNIGRVFWIHVFDVLKNLALYIGLISELFLVSDNLDCHIFVIFMVVALQSLPEGAFSQEANDFVLKGDVIFDHCFVISFIVVISKIELVKWRAFQLFRVFSDKVDFSIV